MMDGEREGREYIHKANLHIHKILVAPADEEQSAMPLLHSFIYLTINTDHCQSWSTGFLTNFPFFSDFSTLCSQLHYLWIISTHKYECLLSPTAYVWRHPSLNIIRYVGIVHLIRESQYHQTILFKCHDTCRWYCEYTTNNQLPVHTCKYKNSRTEKWQGKLTCSTLLCRIVAQVFNSFKQLSPRCLKKLLQFSHLNLRMHVSYYLSYDKFN